MHVNKFFFQPQMDRLTTPKPRLELYCFNGCCNQTGEIRDIVCAEGAGLLQSKERCAILSARGGVGLLQSKRGCAISSARVMDCCNQRGFVQLLPLDVMSSSRISFV